MGQYVDNHLGTGEHVVFETKNHWMIFVSLWSLFTLLIGPIIAMIANEFAITNKRVIIKEGLVSRRSLEINLSKIESVVVQQSILGRILGYGTLVIKGTGGTNEPFHKIVRPLEFRRRFQELSHA